MKKKEVVKSNILFNKIIHKGKKYSNKYFTVFYVLKSDEKPFFGISAPNRLGNAVVRNKVKRQTRALVDELKISFKNNRNYIIIIKEAFLEARYIDRLEALKKLIGEMNEN